MTGTIETAQRHAVTIRRAAIDAIARRLDDYPRDGDLADLWERSPELTQHEANQAVLIAADIARLSREMVAFMGALANVGSAAGGRPASPGTGRG